VFDAAKFPLGVYATVMVCAPNGGLPNDIEPCPLLEFRTVVPNTVDPCENVTVPVGVKELLVAVTAAVHPTGSPTTLGFALLVTLIVVAAARITTVTVELPAAYIPSPEYAATAV
jgi:hypothetical protein